MVFKFEKGVLGASVIQNILANIPVARITVATTAALVARLFWSLPIAMSFPGPQKFFDRSPRFTGVFHVLELLLLSSPGRKGAKANRAFLRRSEKKRPNNFRFG